MTPRSDEEIHRVTLKNGKMTKHIKIAIADDHIGFLTLLSDYLSRRNNMEVVIKAIDGIELLAQLKKTAVDIILLDIEMPVMDGRATFVALKSHWSSIKVIIHSFHTSPDVISGFIKNGANAYVSKSQGIDVLVAAIESVILNGYYAHTSTQQVQFQQRKSQKRKTILDDPFLTDREKEIMRLICKGKSNGEISLELHLSQRTIENHRLRISKKIDVNSTALLVVYAISSGIYEIDS